MNMIRHRIGSYNKLRKDTYTLKNIETYLETIDITNEAPVNEPERQYYFMKKARAYVKQISDELQRPLTFCVTTFGCQMNARDSEKLVGVLGTDWMMWRNLMKTKRICHLQYMYST